MRKFLLFGTMLGVATTALAFGGIFGGSSNGSKSATYKGGVDAIGVHFGGEKKTADSQPEEDKCSKHGTWNYENSTCDCEFGYTGEDCNCVAPYVFNQSTKECECPEEKQCGGNCCKGHNVCNKETGQCCDEGNDFCCPSDQMAYLSWMGKGCCTNVYCITVDRNKNCMTNYACCDEGEPYVWGRFSYGDTYACCSESSTIHKGMGVDGADICCSAGKVPKCTTTDESGVCLQHICCSENEEPYWAPWEAWSCG